MLGASLGARHISSRPGRPLRAKITTPKLKTLERERLTGLLPDLLERGLGIVVGPAGSGKTTVLAHLVSRASREGAHAAWYRAESSDADEHALVAGIERSIAHALPSLDPRWTSIEDVAIAFDAWDGPHILLAIDDFHIVEGSAGAAAIERLVSCAPPKLCVLLASRSLPGLNLPRLRLNEALVEVGPDALRFRSWEVERLFEELYNDPLSPDDLAELTGRVEGWAAGLQLFHLATAGIAPAERRRILRKLGSGSRVVREYLARNVLDALPDDLREFIVSTAVLGRLDPRSCDELLGRTDSRRLLAELERRQICAPDNADDGPSYRYHEVFRSYLESVLVEREGEPRAKELFGRAGRLLEEHGALPEALRAFSLAEDAPSVARLLGGRGRQIAEGHGDWIESLPASMTRQDPWLLLASARRHRAAGRVADALDAYRRAERDFVGSHASAICRRERQALALWLEPPVSPPDDWCGVLRRATAESPARIREAAASLAEPHRSFVTACAWLLGGSIADARRAFASVAQHAETSPALEIAARIGSVVASLLAGGVAVEQAERVMDDAERAGLGWLARLMRAALVGTQAARRASDEPSPADDPWGPPLAALLEGWARLGAPAEAVPLLRAAGDGFAKAGAPVLEAWANAALGLALTHAGDAEGRRLAMRAGRDARVLGVRGAQGIAARALAAEDPNGSYAELAAAVERECDIHLPAPRVAQAPGVAPAPRVAPATRVASAARQAASSIAVRCFGSFAIERDGAPIDLSGVRPRARRLLRMLAVHGGRPLHREVLIESLWGEMSVEAATRNLHVTISSLRSALDGDLRRMGQSLIMRDGDTYRLALAEDASDVAAFDLALAEARRAQHAGDTEGLIVACERAVEVHGAGLLPEEGPAEWIVEERARRQAEATQAGLMAGRAYMDRGDPAAAARMCERLVRIDRYNDDAWRLAIGAYRAADNAAASALVKGRYAKVLRELDVVEGAMSPR